MTDIEEKIRMRLFELRDDEYRAFHTALMPTIDPKRVIGVRTPALRALGREIAKNRIGAEEYLAALPHEYYEENNLHALLIERMTTLNGTAAALDEFLPHVDNWATCDIMSPRAFKKAAASGGKDRESLLGHIRRWIASDHDYTVRFAIGMLMKYFLDDAFDAEYPCMVAEVQSDEYYVNMMRAWYFATALAKQPNEVMAYLRRGCLDEWTHNKTIRKALESYRISDEMKAELRTLKR